MGDIRNRSDIELLVDEFYTKLLEDKVVSYLFTEIAQIDLKEHKPIIVDFWETLLLDNIVYKGNAMQKHILLNEKEKLTNEHFETWLNHWHQTIMDNFSGPVADEAIRRSKMIADLMRYKVDQQTRFGI